MSGFMNFDFDDKNDEAEEEEPIVIEKKSTRSRSRRRTPSRVSEPKPEVKPEAEELDEGAEESEVAEPMLPAPIPSAEAEKEVKEEQYLIRHLWPSRRVVRGTPSGEVYTFEGAGDVKLVNASDLDYLFSANRNDARGCCGSRGRQIIFELA